MRNIFKQAEKSLILQHGQSDCGIACLASIIKFHGGEASFKRIGELSGGSVDGVSLLGLYQAAEQLGFDAEGLQAESIENLNELNNPAVLHVTIENILAHFVVFYGFESGKAVIGDPAKGVVKYSIPELAAVWKSMSLLNLIPNPHFVKAKSIKAEKRKWLVNLIKDDLKFLLLSVFLGILISLFSLSTAIFSQQLIDRILPDRNINRLYTGLSLLLIILLVRTAANYLRGFLVVAQSQKFNERILEQFYSRILRLPKYFFDTRKIGELIARMNDTRRIQTVITYIAGNVIIDSLILISSLIFLFVYSSLVGSVLISSIVIFCLLVRSFHKRILVAQNEVMQSYALAESHYVDSMQGIGTIKVNNREEFFDSLNKHFNSNFQKRIFDLGMLNNRFGFFSEFVGTAFILSVIAITSQMVFHNFIQLGELIAILSVASGLIPSLSRLVLANVQVQEARIAFDRMYEFASMRPEDNDTDEGGSFDVNSISLKIENVSFRFPGQQLLLKDISLTINVNELVVVSGESGCGKSTLIQILQKFYKQESGRIKVNGRPFDDLPLRGWRNVIGVVPQEVKIFNGSLLYNIALTDDVNDLERAVQFCHDFRFDEYFERLPQGYLSLVGEEGIALSGGQKQLVGLARALYKRPRLLMLDEATASLDRHTEKFVLDLLSRLKPEMPILLITHKTEATSFADRVYWLKNGYIQESERVGASNKMSIPECQQQI